ncbi:MAG: hypothetical protein WDN27_04675 [Candidatus Saccharibacteria bacterium]
MEPIRRNPQDIGPGQPRPQRPEQPARRPVFSDFNMRPAISGAPKPVQPGVSAPPRPQPVQPHHPTQPLHAHPTPALAPQPQPKPFAALPPKPAVLRPVDPQPAAPTAHTLKEPKESKPHEKTPRTGLVGLAVFIVLGIIAFSPFVAGKILNNFPGNSQSFSSGGQSLACATALGTVHTSQKYDLKLGFPIVYKYTNTTTQQATCGSQTLSAPTSQTGQFNPLGAAIDLAAALVIAILAARLWGKLRKPKNVHHATHIRV